MHNLVSYNQLAGWKGRMEEVEQDHESAVNDYFQCLIECDDTDSVCKRVCKEVLVYQLVQRKSITLLTFSWEGFIMFV